MSLRKNFARLNRVFAVGFTALMLGAPRTAASVEAHESACPRGWFCLYDRPGFSGRMVKYQHGGDLAGFRDKAESFVNNTGYSVTLTNYHGWPRPDETITVSAGHRDRDMSRWKNRVDKVKVNR